jgi:predicted metal-binding membrane protein
MNVAAMAIITLLIFAEKSLPHGPHIGRIAALLLIAYGALVVVMPQFLPTMLPGMPGDGMGGMG